MSDGSITTFLEVVLPHAMAPLGGRDEIEDPLQDALLRAELGEVTGGGTGAGLSIIDVEVTDLVKGLALIREVLVALNVPTDTVINQYQPVRAVHRVYGETA